MKKRSFVVSRQEVDGVSGWRIDLNCSPKLSAKAITGYIKRLGLLPNACAALLVCGAPELDVRTLYLVAASFIHNQRIEVLVSYCGKTDVLWSLDTKRQALSVGANRDGGLPVLRLEAA